MNRGCCWGEAIYAGDLTAGFACELAHDALSPEPGVLTVVVDAVAAGFSPPVAGEFFGVNFRKPILHHAAVDEVADGVLGRGGVVGGVRGQDPNHNPAAECRGKPVKDGGFLGFTVGGNPFVESVHPIGAKLDQHVLGVVEFEEFLKFRGGNRGRPPAIDKVDEFLAARRFFPVTAPGFVDGF